MKKWLRATTAFAGAAALTLGGAVAAVAANSVDDGSNVKAFNVTWSDDVKRYDPALEGTKVDVLLYCPVSEFKDGEATGKVLGYEWPRLTLTVGKDEQIPLDVNLKDPSTRALTRLVLGTVTSIAPGAMDTASSLFQPAIVMA